MRPGHHALIEEVGWIITPDEIKGRMQALDSLIRNLGNDVARSTSPKVTPQWRNAYEQFAVRWYAFKGSTDAPFGRWFATRWEPRYQDFLGAYEKWLAEFQTRRDPNQPSTALPPSAQMKDLSDELTDKLSTPAGVFSIGVLGAAAFVALLVFAKR